MNKILLILLFISSVAFAQLEEDPEVGLVLSGGGAKGLAHIGALKVLEEAGVEIDYIGGTSMGAIIGSLYAAGYSAHALDSLFRETNFEILIQDELPRSIKTLYEKKEAGKYVLSLPFDDFDLSLPSGLSKGQNLYNLMSRLTLHLKDQKDFEHLPIPFFAVATDVETGEEIILDKGHLPQAVLASAAIPTLFGPVLVEGRLLTDGGVTNNYPVEELIKRGADIVIGVDVQDSLLGRENLGSAFDILTQISNFGTIKDMKGKIEKTDVYIAPKIKGFNVMSFDQGEKIIQAGEKAAAEKMLQLKVIAALQDIEQRERKKIERIDSLYIADVRIEGNQTYPRAYIIGKLKLRYPSKVSYDDFILGINNLSATGNFRMVDYKLLPLNGGYVLELNLEESSNKTFFKMAFHYDDFYKSAVVTNLTKKSLLFTNDIASIDVVLGDNFRYNFQYYWDKGYYWSLGIKSRYNSFDKNVDIGYAESKIDLSEINVNKIALEYSDFTNQVYFETLFGKTFSLGLGAEQKYLKVLSETISQKTKDNFPVTIFDEGHYYSTFGSLTFDSYDDKYLPTKGLYFHGDFHLYLLSSKPNIDFFGFSIAKGDAGYAFRPARRFTTRISSGAGFTLGNNNTKSLNFLLGGYGNNFINNIVPFYGYDFLELSGNSYLKGLLELDYEIFQKHHLIASANVANVEDDLYDSSNWLLNPDYTGYALGYSVESFLGPLQVKYSFSPENNSSLWFFSLGFWF